MVNFRRSIDDAVLSLLLYQLYTMTSLRLLLVALAMVGGASAAGKPNVLVLFADDMGVSDLGVYGHPTIASPHLDRLANAGVRFTAWYSGFHICSPSRAAMLTGRLCVRSGTCGSNRLGGVFSNMVRARPLATDHVRWLACSPM